MLAVLKLAISFLLGGLLVAALLLANSGQRPPGGARVVYAQEPMLVPEAPNASPQLLFQGQLTNPTTGQPVPDGAYAMTFNLYNVTTGGSPLWSEAKQVSVTSGSFATLIGSVTPLNVDIFNGQNLYLGIQVAGDPEAVPRQPIGYNAYAIRADRAGVADSAATASNADKLDNLDSGDFVRQGGGGVVAYGVVDANGSRIDGKRFSSSRRSTGLYAITIEGEDYNLNRYSTAVTVVDNDQCPSAVIGKTGSAEGKLDVYLYNLSNQRQDCKFHFITFEP